jgi:hypothetical protein
MLLLAHVKLTPVYTAEEFGSGGYGFLLMLALFTLRPSERPSAVRPGTWSAIEPSFDHLAVNQYRAALENSKT